jgi:hypothetical protein
MRTPFGSECPFFYGDYYRGRNQEECRLFENRPQAKDWTSELCRSCPVPAIKRANACENMMLIPRIVRSVPTFKKKVTIQAYCEKSQQVVKNPEVGCGLCHPENQHFTFLETK